MYLYKVECLVNTYLVKHHKILYEGEVIIVSKKVLQDITEANESDFKVLEGFRVKAETPTNKTQYDLKSVYY